MHCRLLYSSVIRTRRVAEKDEAKCLKSKYRACFLIVANYCTIIVHLLRFHIVKLCTHVGLVHCCCHSGLILAKKSLDEMRRLNTIEMHEQPLNSDY